MSMADYLHQLAHNKTQRGYSTPAWTAYFNDHVQRLLQPAEQSDDPWGEVIHPTSADLGVQ